MSVSSIIDKYSNDPDFKNKIYPDLIPWNHPGGQQGLGSVLQVSNSAFIPNTTTAQDATDFATLGCVKIETGTVGMGNQPALVIGEPGDLLQIKGGTLLGSLLAGNGVNTETLPLGTNGYVLTADSSAGVGVKWASAGGAGVASITAGSNIGVNNAIPTAPVVSLLSPLTSTLNVGTQNVQGTTTQITLTNGGSQAVQQATTGFTSIDSTLATTKASLFKNAISVETSTNKVQMTPTYVLKTVGTTAFQVGTVGSAQLQLVGAGGFADGISISQLFGQGTTLTTPLSNVKYYPDTYLNNNNSSTVSVPAPQVINQRLTLNNLGLSTLYQWNDYNNPVFSGYSAFTIDSNSNVWLAQEGTGNIQVWDNAISTQLYTITVSGMSGTPKVNVFYEAGGYMWIGGVFDTINGNATLQYSITRVSLSTYGEDPIVDGSNFIYGVQGGQEVLTIYEDNPNALMLFGGNFTNFSNGGQASYIASIASPFATTGSQTFAEFFGGMNNRVYVIYVASNRVFVGGDFTISGVNSGSPVGYQYCSYWDWSSVAWLDTALNTLNGSVYAIEPTPYGYIWLGGAFNSPSPTPYNVYIEDATPQNWVDTTLNMTTPILRSQSFGNGSTFAVMNGTNLYESSSFQQWVDLNAVGGTGTVKGVNSFNGTYKVIYDSYNYIRSLTVLTHQCIFTGPFKYDGTLYANYTIATRDVSQMFIGDNGCVFWSIIGQGVGTFS
jgi:hypothetical protein